MSLGVGGRLRGVSVFRPGPRLVLLQPSEDRPPLRPSVPPAVHRGRLPGSHPALCPPATTDDRAAAANPRSPRARTTGRTAGEGGDPEETSISP